MIGSLHGGVHAHTHTCYTCTCANIIERAYFHVSMLAWSLGPLNILCLDFGHVVVWLFFFPFFLEHVFPGVVNFFFLEHISSVVDH